MIDIKTVFRTGLAFFLSLALHLQASAYETRFYDNSSLSSHMITTICQDADGFIWVGTEYGLNKFDGHVFTHYFASDDVPNPLADNRVFCLKTDDKGRVWVISDAGLQYYDKISDGFMDISFPEEYVPVLRDIVFTSNGEILLLDFDSSIWKVDLSGMSAYPLPDVAELYRPMSDASSMIVDRLGRIWVCVENDGVVLYDRANSRTRCFSQTELGEGNPTGIVETVSGDICVVCETGIVIYDEDSASMCRVCSPPARIVEREVYVTSDGQIIVGTHGQGVYRYDVWQRRLVPMWPSDICPELDLSIQRVHAFYEDASGNFWVGCSQKGLLCVLDAVLPFRYDSLGDMFPGSGGLLMGLAVGKDGSLMVGQQGNGLNVLDMDMNVRKTFLKGNAPIAMLPVSESVLWVGTYSDGAYIVDMASGRETPVPALRDKWIKSLARDLEGNVYVAEFNGDLRSFAPDGREERILGGGKLALNNRYLNTLYTDIHGRIWVGHYYGFDVYDPVTDSLVPVDMDMTLRQSAVFSIMQTSDSLIWLGTDSGLWSYDFDDGKWDRYTRADGLNNDVICHLMEDKHGNIWMSTFRGLSYLDRKEDKFYNYYKGDGLEAISYLRGTGCICGDGRMYFGNDNGITSFMPGQVAATDFAAEPRVVALLVGGRSRAVDSDRISLTFRDNTFAVRFSTMDFRNPQNIVYEYRFADDRQDVWLRTPMGISEIAFNNLSAGKHELYIRAVYNGTNSSVRKVSIQILPPWYLSGWAVLCYILLVGGIVVLLWQLFSHKQHSRMNEEKIKFFVDLSHEIRSPLTLIKSPIEQLLKQEHDPQTGKALDTILRNADRLLLLVNQILSIRKFEKGQMKMEYSQVNLADRIRNVCRDYEYYAEKHNINFRFTDLEENLPVWVDQRNIDKVIVNLVSNAMKYVSDGGEVTVRLDTAEERDGRRRMRSYARLTVSDNGTGIDEKLLEKVFERFYSASANTSHGQLGYGIGLNLTSNIVTRHGGVVRARNRKDMQGSEFTVLLPLGKSHLPEDSLVENVPLVVHEPEFHPVEESGQKERAHTGKKRTSFHILVVDDDEEMRMFLSDLLGGAYHVRTCANGVQALAMMAENVPDLVISDVVMPQMDGIALLHRIKNNTSTSHIPVILLTSKVGVESRIRGFEYGADAYVDKPFNVEELRARVDALLSNRRRVKGKLLGVQEQEGVVRKVELKGNDAALMERVMKCINQRLTDSDFNVEVLASEVGISRVQLHRRIKNITGISVGEFIRNIRMKQAGELLLKGDVTVSQVTYAVGLSNPTHFTAAFRKYFGVTPSEYLKNHASKSPIDTKDDADATKV